jgi:hypothetical protein
MVRANDPRKVVPGMVAVIIVSPSTPPASKEVIKIPPVVVPTMVPLFFSLSTTKVPPKEEVR